jgi:2-C-methyl-D-erythritol 4-phosphate cytidylyltransferase
VIDSVLGALAAGADAAVPVLPVADTIRRVDATGALAGTIDRSTLVAVQTPQGFRRELLDRAHEQASDDTATDDAVLIEAIGGTVVAVAGDEAAFKITTPADLRRAAAHLSD